MVVRSFLVFVVAVASASASRSDDNLKGLDAFRVEIETLTDDSLAHGLTSSQIQTDVELKLRLAGVRVTQQVVGVPILYVVVNSVEIRAGQAVMGSAVAIDVAVLLDVPTRTGRTLSDAWIWTRGHLKVIGTDYADAVRGAIKDQIDAFLNSYRKANPKSA